MLEIFKIKEIDFKRLIILDQENKEYEIWISFHGFKEEIKPGNLIKMDRNLLNEEYEGYAKVYNFGPLDSKYGRKIIDKEDEDLIKIKIGTKVFKLKRLYG